MVGRPHGVLGQQRFITKNAAAEAEKLVCQSRLSVFASVTQLAKHSQSTVEGATGIWRHDLLAFTCTCASDVYSWGVGNGYVRFSLCVRRFDETFNHAPM